MELFWGIKTEDNGNHLNPYDSGTLQLDENFGDLFSPAGQKFLYSMCQSIKQQSFFVSFPFDQPCPTEAFIKACTSPQTPCCGVNASFPFPAETAEKCVKGDSKMAQTGALFDAQGKIIGFHMRIVTNQPFTTNFTAMDGFWKKVTSWVDRRKCLKLQRDCRMAGQDAGDSTSTLFKSACLKEHTLPWEYLLLYHLCSCC